MLLFPLPYGNQQVKAVQVNDNEQSTAIFRHFEVEGQWCKIQVVIKDKDTDKSVSVDEIRYGKLNASKYWPEFIKSGKATFLGKKGDSFSLLVEKGGYSTYTAVFTVKGDAQIEVHIKRSLKRPDPINLLLRNASRGNKDAYEELLKMGRLAIPSLVKQMGSEELEIAAMAAVILSDIGELSVPPLISQLSHPDEQVVELAIVSLVQIGKPAIQPLIKIVENEKEKLQLYAAISLCRIGKPTLPYLEKAVKKPDIKPPFRNLIEIVIEAIKQTAKVIDVYYEVPDAAIRRSRGIRITVEDITGRVQTKIFYEWPGIRDSIKFEVMVPVISRTYIRGRLQKEQIIWSKSVAFQINEGKDR